MLHPLNVELKYIVVLQEELHVMLTRNVHLIRK